MSISDAGNHNYFEYLALDYDLLNNIARHPNNDYYKLIYSDLMEEKGYIEESELLRNLIHNNVHTEACACYLFKQLHIDHSLCVKAHIIKGFTQEIILPFSRYYIPNQYLWTLIDTITNKTTACRLQLVADDEIITIR